MKQELRWIHYFTVFPGNLGESNLPSVHLVFENESREGDGEEKQITNYAEREMKYHMLDANALREKSSLVTFTRYLMKLPIFVINATQKIFLATLLSNVFDP